MNKTYIIAQCTLLYILSVSFVGAKSVNLVPADKPQDVYMEIASIVERKRGEDAAQGVEIAQRLEGRSC